MSRRVVGAGAGGGTGGAGGGCGGCGGTGGGGTGLGGGTGVGGITVSPSTVKVNELVLVLSCPVEYFTCTLLTNVWFGVNGPNWNSITLPIVVAAEAIYSLLSVVALLLDCVVINTPLNIAMSG